MPFYIGAEGLVFAQWRISCKHKDYCFPVTPSTKCSRGPVCKYEGSLCALCIHMTRNLVLRALFAEVTGFLNARPLTYQSGDPGDLCALTQNHFLLHRASPVIHPETRATDGYRSDYAFLQRIADEVWRRWSTKYVPTLTKRAKWQNEARDLKVGDAVLIVEGNAPRGK